MRGVNTIPRKIRLQIYLEKLVTVLLKDVA